MSNGDSFVLSDEELKKIIDDALNGAPPIEDMPVADTLIKGDDGLFYFVYTLKAEDIDGLDQDVTVYYTDTTNYKQSFTTGNVDDIKASGLFFGDLSEVDTRMKGRNPLHLLLDDLKDELKLNDYILKAAESDGNFNAVGVFLESLFEGRPAEYKDYAIASDYINALSGDQLAYFKAQALGTDPKANATLRRLQDNAKIELAGLVSKYAQYEVPQDVLDYLYDQRVKGILTKESLAEQYKLLVFPEIPGFRNDDIVEFMSARDISIPDNLAYIDKAKDQVNAKVGPYLSGLFTDDDYRTFSNVLAETNGSQLLDAQLQTVWDENVADKYKGKNYTTSVIGIRTMANRYGRLDETGRDRDLVYNLFTIDDPSEQRKQATAHFLNVGDEGALQKMGQDLTKLGFSPVYLSPTITGQG
jgi:hypothetical protein